MLKFKNTLIVTLVLLLLMPIITIAQEPDDTGDTQTKCTGDKFCLNVPIGNIREVSGLEEYIQVWYSFVVGVVGILAAVIIMWGGFKWLTSRGNSAAISDAKDRIWSAIIGLILVFLSYNLLNLINPRLVNLYLPSLPTNSFTSGSTSAGQATGSITPPIEEIPLPDLTETVRFDYQFTDLESGPPWEFTEEVSFTPDGQGQYFASWDSMNDMDSTNNMINIGHFLTVARDSGLPVTITGIQTTDALYEVTDAGIDMFNPNNVIFSVNDVASPDDLAGDILGVRISTNQFPNSSNAPINWPNQ